ncbi:TPA: helix-turn-helix domain-containing protein [Haemophilus influenzae]|uniref:helix-turn-helix domain-containing protein n=1 Tax=Haemophilus influenzae TaxID=727 RepID=UPI00280B2B1B|nr:helix-turn-helix domain-containing protein [Haemophilus influenzae]
MGYKFKRRYFGTVEWSICERGGFLMERYFSIKEIVQMGICSEATVKRWIASGKLKSYKFGRSRKIAESDLNEFIKTCRR